MEAREDRDPGYDDWFDEPEPPTETQSGQHRGVYEDVEEVWMLPEEEGGARGGGRREILVGGRALTTTQLAIIAVSVLAVFFGILAAFGVFNGTKAPTPRVTPPPKHVTTPAKTSTTAVTPAKAQAPAQTLKPGDTGSQVKVLQRALAALGFSPGKPDGDYGTSTQSAVERFQASKGLGQDGIVGAQTLNALQRALSSTTGGTTTSTTPTTEAPTQTLKPGDTGSQVKALQRGLAALGFSPGKPDGDYGPSTKNAVERFQASKGIAEDGVVGPQTLNALQKALSG
jgi:peptidoglycan hydrolase-like protein with peptidoglycan-binding domain